jgi:hypothetical protein
VIRMDIRKGAKYAGKWRKVHNENFIIFSLHLIFYSDKSKQGQMGKSHSTHRKIDSDYKIMLRKSEIKRTLNRFRL